MAIHKKVAHGSNEKVLVKTEVSCFNGIGLSVYLTGKGIKDLVVVRMQTHMCVEAVVRLAYDLDYSVKLILDVCTTKELEVGGCAFIPSGMVHK